jgi:hypothetical protein
MLPLPLCLTAVHRQEGRCIGEFGSGFRNANYWYRAAGDHPISQDVFKVGLHGFLVESIVLGDGRCRCS